MRGTIRYWLDAPASVFQNAPAKPVVRKGEPFVYLALSGGGGSGEEFTAVHGGVSRSAVTHSTAAARAGIFFPTFFATGFALAVTLAGAASDFRSRLVRTERHGCV